MGKRCLLLNYTNDVRISLWPNRIKMLGKLMYCLKCNEADKYKDVRKTYHLAWYSKHKMFFKVKIEVIRKFLGI